jgi:dienelactone hydrolase
VNYLPSRSAAVIIFSLVLPGLCSAAPTDAERCLSAKHKAVGKYQACVLGGFADAVADSAILDTSRCDGSLLKAFTAAEDRYGSSCRTSGDASILASRGSDLAAALDTLLDPGSAADGQLACLAGKLEAAARLASCLEKAETKVLAKQLLRLDDSKCSAKLAAAIARLEAAGSCPAGGDAASINAAVQAAFREGEADLADLGTVDFASPGRFHITHREVTFVDETRPTRPNGTYEGAPDRTIVAAVTYPVFSSVSGKLPLVIRAHGFGGFRYDSTDLTDQLASRGMIVVSPEFPLSNLTAPGGPTLLDLDEQITDISYVIDQLIAVSSTPGSFLEGKIDQSRIGVVGHSLGGATVLGAAYHPTLADHRIKAVVALAPLSCIYQHAFYAGGSAPLIIVSGTADIVTLPASNHLAAYANANPEKYLVSLDGGLHTNFANDFLHDDSLNADDALACPSLIPPGSPRPVTLDIDIPDDFLGGAAAGVDTTASTCEPICPLPGPTWMPHARQTEIGLAATTAMLERVFFSSGPADRLLTERLDSENDDVAVTYQR